MAKKKIDVDQAEETPAEALAEAVEYAPTETAFELSEEAPEVMSIDSQAIQSVQGQVVQLDRCAVSGVTAEEDAYIDRSLVVGGVAANGNAETSRSLVVGGVAAGGDAQASNGAMVAMVAGKDASLQAGYASVVVAGADVEISQAGVEVMVVGGDLKAENTFIGMVLSGNVELGEGSRVLLNTPQAIAFGAALGAAFGAVSFLLRRRKR